MPPTLPGRGRKMVRGGLVVPLLSPAEAVHDITHRKPAGGWKKDLQPDWQKLLRIEGGFPSVQVEGRTATVRHHEVDGRVVHEATIARWARWTLELRRNNADDGPREQRR